MQERALPLDNRLAPADGAREMIKLGITIVAVVAALVAAKETNALQRAELLSSCAEVAAPRGDESTWQACRAGRLDGMPDLSLKSCRPRGVSGSFAYWSCPTRITSGRRTE
jgi:hypothetical protein